MAKLKPVAAAELSGIEDQIIDLVSVLRDLTHRMETTFNHPETQAAASARIVQMVNNLTRSAADLSHAIVTVLTLDEMARDTEKMVREAAARS